MSEGSNGVVLLAHGRDEFFRQSATLAWSIKLNSPGVPVALACDRKASAVPLRWIFDEIVEYDFSSWPGVSAKVNLDLVTPFTGQTLFLDSDSLVYENLKDIFEKYSHRDFTVLGKNVDSVGHWFKDYNAVKSYFGVAEIPFFIGDFYLFRKGSTDVFSGAREMRSLYEDLGCNRARGGAMSDERLIALSMMGRALAAEPRSDSDIVCLVSPGVTAFSSNVLGGKCSVERYGHRLSTKIIHFADFSSFPQYCAESYRIRFASNGRMRNNKFVSTVGWVMGEIDSYVTRAMRSFRRHYQKLFHCN